MPSTLGHCPLYCRGEREHGKSGLLELSSAAARIGPTHFLDQSKPGERAWPGKPDPSLAGTADILDSDTNTPAKNRRQLQ